MSQEKPCAEAAPLGQLGPWQLVRELGGGELCRVYQARPNEAHDDAEACYAVKFLRPEWEEDPRAVSLVRREAAIGHKISHPHVVPILSSSLRQPPYYVAMPLLAGSTLGGLLAGGRRLSTPEALWIARQAAQGLEALRTGCGAIHADVKPGNLFVAADGHTTLLDLGFARKAEEFCNVTDRPVLGTLTYIAPEMITSALAADTRSDIYSLGVTLYEMLAGHPPFEAEEAMQMAVQHREAIPPDLRQSVPGLPVGVADLVHEMLSKEPLRRPQTPRELIRRLTELEIETFGQRPLARRA